MKKHILALCMTALACLAVGCNPDSQTPSGPSNNPPASEEVTSLSKPSGLTLNGRVLTWNKVQDAEGYVLEINGVTYQVNGETYTLADGVYGRLDVRVKAVCGTVESSYSEKLSIAAEWQLAVPQGLVQDGNIIRWNEVAGAQGYTVNINGIKYSTTTNSYTYAVTQPTVVKVLACGNADGLLSSEYSAELTLKAALATPVLRASGTKVQWNEVANAEKYEVYANGQKIGETESLEYELKYQFVGEVKVSVKAVTTAQNYVSSALSSELTIILIQQTLTTPQNVRFDGENAIIWDEVDGADGYVVYKNGNEYATVTTNRYEIPSEFKNEEVVQLQIKATSSLHAASSLSSAIDVGMVSESNPVLISTVAEFNAMSVSGHYKLANNIALTQSQITTFKGTLDGNGYKITGLTSSLFDTLDGAKIKNLTIENAVLSVTLSQEGEAVGALANYMVGASLIDCEVSATVTVTSQNAIGYVGGIVGISEYSNMNGVTFSGTVTTSYCVTGGVVGVAREPLAESTFTACSAEVVINVTGGEKTHVGGFIGHLNDNALTIENSHVNAQIITNGSYCGGFVGYMGFGKIKNSRSSGSIVNTNASIAHVGGFIGRVEGYNNKVIGCISSMTITAEEAQNGSVIRVGGFVGHTVTGTYATVYENCYYDYTLANIDRVGYGKGDGITKKTTQELESMN